MASKLDQQQWVRVGVAIALFTLAGGILISRSCGTQRAAAQAWFLNLETGELTASDSLASPVTLRSGAQAVRAHVYSCNSCDDAESRTIAYVEKTVPVEQSASDGPPPIGAPPPDSGVRVSDDRGATWHSLQSTQGQAVIVKAEPRNACPDPQNHTICNP